MTEARIAGVGDYLSEEAAEPLTDLKPLVKEATGAVVRRIGRFISLALIGSARAVAGRPVPPDTAVYFTTGSGDFEVTVEVMEHLFRDGFPPKPLSFINTVSNAACFYVAKQFGLTGRSTCLGSRHFGFETALQLALLDLKRGTVASALVGTADIVMAPLDIHRRRLGQADGAPIAEAAHWIWLTGEGEGPAVAACDLFPDRETLSAWLARQDLTGAKLSAGPSLPPEDLADLAAETGLAPGPDYLAGRPYYDSQTAAVVSAFLSSGEGGLLHLNADPDGRYAAILLRR